MKNAGIASTKTKCHSDKIMSKAGIYNSLYIQGHNYMKCMIICSGKANYNANDSVCNNCCSQNNILIS